MKLKKIIFSIIALICVLVFIGCKSNDNTGSGSDDGNKDLPLITTFSYKMDGERAVINGAILTDVTVEFPKTIDGIAIKGIDTYCFKNNFDIKNIIVPEGYEVIGEQAFYNCSNLQSVVLPSSITSLGKNSFRKCDAIKNVKIGSVLENKSMVDSSHILDTAITVEVLEGVTEIKDNLFENNGTIEKIVLPNTITSIGEKSFFGCKRLNSINIPSGI